MTKICVDAYKNLNLQVIDGGIAISPCCITPAKKVDKIDFVNDSYLNEYRKSFAKGEFHKSCLWCSGQEQQNATSRRQSSNQWYIDNQKFDDSVNLTRLDYWTGDLCNLKCAICGPESSTSWKEELGIPVNQKKIINKFWNNLDLNHIKFIHFNGGEPLLVKEHVKFLQEISNKHEIHLNYNTNGTVLPTQTLLDLWKQFKLVQIDFSIDDVGERFEYQRFPAKWDEVINNLIWFINNCPVNCMFATNTTISILNYHNLHNLDLWLKENFHTNRVTDPIEHRKQLADGLFALSTVEENKEKILEFLDTLDQRRSLSWRKVFPELATVLC
jgi:sulfatase maturation enzyme AslB (radical SAM superfamily)